MTSTATLLSAVTDASEDYEWYPTTQRMIDVVKRRIGDDADSIMDIGAGDGRVLIDLASKCTHAKLYAIEKSAVLVQAQPETVVPVGANLFEQNLACLQVDYIFSNPPYSNYEAWASVIAESGYAKKAFLIIPCRWKDSQSIAASLKKRGAKARIIHTDNFYDGERRARAVVDIVEVSYPRNEYHHEEVTDPFDIWFDQHIDTFEKEDDLKEDVAGEDMARVNQMRTISEMVEAHNEEYARMEENYRAIFKLDYALLKELNVSKENVREGIKKRMAGLKTKYWECLFSRLDTITNRLSTKTKEEFLRKLTGSTSIAFTSSNAYAVVLWSIKNANKYYDSQLIQLFRDLSTFDGVLNYKSNQRTWNRSQWRFMDQNPTHYALDYRIVVSRHSAIANVDTLRSWDHTGNLHKCCHELIGDVIAVLYNLGFSQNSTASYLRHWESGSWQDFTSAGEVLFQVKGHKNGNLHFRFMPKAIMRLNVEAGRLLRWLKNTDDVATELGYSAEDAKELFGCHRLITPSSVKLLEVA